MTFRGATYFPQLIVGYCICPLDCQIFFGPKVAPLTRLVCSFESFYVAFAIILFAAGHKGYVVSFHGFRARSPVAMVQM